MVQCGWSGLSSCFFFFFSCEGKWHRSCQTQNSGGKWNNVLLGMSLHNNNGLIFQGDASKSLKKFECNTLTYWLAVRVEAQWIPIKATVLVDLFLSLHMTDFASDWLKELNKLRWVVSEQKYDKQTWGMFKKNRERKTLTRSCSEFELLMITESEWIWKQWSYL